MSDPTPRLRAVNIEQFEHDMDDEQRRINAAVKDVNENDVGRLSAEAVQTQFESAAKAVEDMGNEVRERMQRLEHALREADADMRLIGEAAVQIREKGKLVYLQIEEASNLSKQIREACTEFRNKVGA